MKLYTLQEAAVALGVDVQTLYSWISRSGRNQAVIDPQNPQQPVLTQAPVDQLAHEYNLPILGPLNNNTGVNRAGMPSTPSQTFSNQVPQIMCLLHRVYLKWPII